MVLICYTKTTAWDEIGFYKKTKLSGFEPMKIKP
jgi:hypothetical protein